MSELLISYYEHPALSNAYAVANGGIALLFQSARLVSRFAELGSFGSLKEIDAGVLNVSYAEAGAAVILLHG